MSLKTLLSSGLCLLLLSSCTPQEAKRSIGSVSDIKSLVDQQQQIQKTASLQLTSSEAQYASGATFDVTVTLSNPDQHEIASVRSWLTFDPQKLQTVSINTAQSTFDFYLPQENTFDNEKGLVSLGRSSQKPVTAASNQVATVTFKVLPVTEDAPTTIDFFNYKEDSDGHTGVYRVFDTTTYNILKTPDSPALSLQLLKGKPNPGLKRN